MTNIGASISRSSSRSSAAGARSVRASARASAGSAADGSGRLRRQHIGTVDKVRGDRVILTKSDPECRRHPPQHPCSWIENVDEKVTVNKSAEEAMRAWRDEEQNKALFEGDRAARAAKARTC
jgi:hypothetical protein